MPEHATVWPIGVQTLSPPSMMPPSGRTFSAPHTLSCPPPPHVSGARHVPPSGAQLTLPPQPSPMVPQFIEPEHVVTGTQPELPPHTLSVPPPPHVSGAVQVPQLYVPPHPLLWRPQLKTPLPQATVWEMGTQRSTPPSITPPSDRTLSPPQTLGCPPPPHVAGAVQVPPSGLQVTAPPQPSATTPQFIWLGHAASGMHPELPPHTLCVPPPPHVSGAVQGPPHETVPPQPLLSTPQLSPAHAVAWGIGTHELMSASPKPPSESSLEAPHVLGLPPPPHVVPLAHAAPPSSPAHWTSPPQPSATAPQFMPAGHVVSAMQPAEPPQTLGVPPPPSELPPPHVWGSEQFPQSITLPQPSPCWPQLTARVVHVAGTHAAVPPQTLGVPPPPQVVGAVHMPH
jgi:hypothetical protein